jgi:hypothetical protein
MYRRLKEVFSIRRAADGLEQYRRLVKLQKQMIKLAEKNARSKRECAMLRERVAHEVAARIEGRGRFHQQFHRNAKQMLKRLPGFAMAQSVRAKSRRLYAKSH